MAEATFITSAAKPGDYPPETLPEIAFAGRSNVGKSTLINGLVGRRALAKVSSTPGKTQLINFFRVDDRFHLVDLPGYGYARAPEAERQRWRTRVEDYLTRRDALVRVIMLVDIRHAPSTLDRQLASWLTHIERHTIIVATKADKLPRGKVAAAVSAIGKTLGVTPIPVSASKHTGLDALWREIRAATAPGTTWRTGAEPGSGPHSELTP